MPPEGGVWTSFLTANQSVSYKICESVEVYTERLVNSSLGAFKA